ncbi:MAG: membrane protein insertase YidC [bacterium]
MEKRLVLFIILSFLILYIYSLFIPKKKEIKQIKPSPVKNEVVQKPTIETKEPSLPLVDEKELIFKNSLFSLALSQKGTIKSLNLLKFNDRKGLPYTIIKDEDTFSIFLEEKEIFPNEFSKDGFVYDLQSFKIIKKYEFSSSTYPFTMNLSFINKKDKPITIPGVCFSLKSSLGQDPELKENPFLYQTASGIKKAKNVLKNDEAINWVGAQDKYFLFVVKPEMRFSSILLSPEDIKAFFPRYSLKPNEVIKNKIMVYAGPRDYKILKGVGLESLSGLWFLPKIIILALVFFYKLIGNYGVAIILLTLIVKVLLHPLTRTNFKMMKKMQAIKPHIDKLREKHKDDHETIQKEMMRLYKEHNVNPFGGCLPLILQIPIFFALYSALDKGIELRGAPFVLWIKDLSLKDPYFVLPILMGLTMFIQQKMTPSTQDPSTEKMMLIMPLVMTFLFLSFPSGLVLYWLVQNILTIFEHWLIEKGIGI